MGKQINSLLFVCNMNSVRSPMASYLAEQFLQTAPDQPLSRIEVDSAGLYPGWLDPFTEEVLTELDIDISAYASKRLQDITPEAFDLVIAMTPEAAGEIRKLLPQDRVEFWPIANPSTETGSREAVLSAYRGVRDEIRAKIAERFIDYTEKA